MDYDGEPYITRARWTLQVAGWHVPSETCQRVADCYNIGERYHRDSLYQTILDLMLSGF